MSDSQPDGLRGGRLDVDVVVPTYNERGNIDAFVERMDALGLRESLIVVDNASTDGTAERLQDYPGIRLIRHLTNLGYGASIRDGVRASTAAAIVIIDADLEYPPEAIPRLVSELADHSVVYGSRFRGTAPPPMPYLRRVGNRLISGVFNVLFGQRTTDLYTGMKALRRDTVPDLRLVRDGFEHVAEMGIDLAYAGHLIHEIPVAYTPRHQGRSKMRHVQEALRFTWLMLAAWLGGRHGARG